MLLRESVLGKLGAIGFSIRVTICFVLTLFLLPPKRLRFKINRGRAKKNDHGNVLFMKRKEKYRVRVFIRPLTQGL